MMVTAANAATVTYTTNAAGTEFVSPISGLVLNSSSGPAATLSFSPNVSSTTGVPSNINLGDFILTCTEGCGIGPNFTVFDPFTFHLIVTDTTDNAIGEFIGTSNGGNVTFNSSTVEVDWQAPLSFGPGTTNALSGDFGSTIFDKSLFSITLIVAPNSGTPGAQGDSTVQGQVRALASVPEPASLSLMGGALLGLGILKRRNFLRR